jgi:hypothetical protein
MSNRPITVYLDVDGVLHSLGTPALSGAGYIRWHDPALFCWRPLLESALEPYPETRIVISSSWRFICDDDALQQRVLGPSLGRRFAGITGEEHKGQTRAEEIIEHASDNAIDCFIALDDDPTVLDQERREDDRRFVYCEPHSGISGERALLQLKALLREFSGQGFSISR